MDLNAALDEHFGFPAFRRRQRQACEAALAGRADAARCVGARALFASTATATPQVAKDIAGRLGLRDPVLVTTGFDRPNLAFAVIPCRTAADKRRRLAAALSEPGALPAIVYA